jgi:hypothetical protein
VSDANRLLIRDASPLQGLRPLTEREIFDDLAITKQEPIGKSSATPFGRVFQANPSMQVYNNFISIHKVSLGLASPFRPSPSSFLDVLLHFPNTTIGAGCWKAFGLNAHDLRIKIVGDGNHIIAIDCSEELLERLSCGFHGQIIAMLNIGLNSTSVPSLGFQPATFTCLPCCIFCDGSEEEAMTINDLPAIMGTVLIVAGLALVGIYTRFRTGGSERSVQAGALLIVVGAVLLGLSIFVPRAK